MDKKKICFITTLPITLTAFVVKFATALHKKTGWDIYFICNTTQDFEKQIPDFIHYIPIKIKRGISLSGFRSISLLKKVFLTEQFDMVQYSTTNAATYASIAAKKARIPIRLYCQWGLDYPSFCGMKKIVFKRLEKMICNKSTVIQPDSFGNLNISIRDRLYNAKKGYVVGSGSASGVDFKRFDFNKKNEWFHEIRTKYNLPTDSFVYGYVGRLLRDKGNNELFTAFRLIENDFPTAYLLVVGDNSVFEKIDKELVDWAVKDNRIIFTGFTKETEKYYSALDCFVLPSYHEGFGTSIIEAEAMGIPVISTNIPGPREAVSNNKTGLLIPAKDSDSLYQAMKKLYLDNNLRNYLASNCVKYVFDNFNQDKLFEQLIEDRIGLICGTKNTDYE